MKYILFFTFIFSLISCKTNKKGNENIQDNDSIVKNSVVFTEEHIEMAEIKIGKIQKQILSDFVECTGKIDVTPQGLATISAPIGGFVKKIFYSPGNYAEAGSVLAILQHPDYIKLQQEYLEAKNQLAFFEEEFKRQGELTLDQATSLKKMQKAQSEYRTTDVTMKAMKAQLEFIGINPEIIEKTGFTSEINIYAPINGYITNINAPIGKYIDPYSSMYEMIDKKHLYLHLKIFEKDITKITKGKRVEFNTINSKNISYKTKVTRVGQKINEEDHAIDVYAEINNSENKFTPGMYINAKIFLSNDSVYSLPITSIVKEGENHFIFTKENDTFFRTQVKTSIEQNNFIEIKDADKLKNKQIVTKGAYYLNSTLRKETE